MQTLQCIWGHWWAAVPCTSHTKSHWTATDSFSGDTCAYTIPGNICTNTLSRNIFANTFPCNICTNKVSLWVLSGEQLFSFQILYLIGTWILALSEQQTESANTVRILYRVFLFHANRMSFNDVSLFIMPTACSTWKVPLRLLTHPHLSMASIALLFSQLLQRCPA